MSFFVLFFSPLGGTEVRDAGSGPERLPIPAASAEATRDTDADDIRRHRDQSLGARCRHREERQSRHRLPQQVAIATTRHSNSL